MYEKLVPLMATFESLSGKTDHETVFPDGEKGIEHLRTLHWDFVCCDWERHSLYCAAQRPG